MAEVALNDEQQDVVRRYVAVWRRWRQGSVSVWVAVFSEPQPQEFFVEILWLFVRSKVRWVRIELPIPGRIWRMNFIDEHEASILVGSKFVFRIH